MRWWPFSKRKTKVKAKLSVTSKPLHETFPVRESLEMAGGRAGERSVGVKCQHPRACIQRHAATHAPQTSVFFIAACADSAPVCYTPTHAQVCHAGVQVCPPRPCTHSNVQSTHPNMGTLAFQACTCTLALSHTQVCVYTCAHPSRHRWGCGQFWLRMCLGLSKPPSVFPEVPALQG